MANQKVTFISVLFSLLVFQSLWNIAAAFCVHENVTISLSNGYSSSANHFGHHQQSKTCIDDAHLPISDPFSFAVDDHHDHLPSFTQLILNEAHEAYFYPITTDVIRQFKIDWSNLYQSPDLVLNSPPPMLSPLLVG